MIPIDIRQANRQRIPLRHLYILGSSFLLLFVLLLATSQTALAQVCSPYAAPQLRFGFNLDKDSGQQITEFDTTQLGAHWFLDYHYYTAPIVPADMNFAQTLRAGLWLQNNYTNSVVSAVQANPGALWIIGNEPDRYGQDGLLPEQFAAFYHDFYTLIKATDITSQVAVGAVVQATPIRLRYLNQVLDEYNRRYSRQLPTDLWTVHGFILRECNTAGCWGASIPPGLDDFASEGILYEVEDHGDLEIFKSQIRTFRQWMTDNGYRQKPLLVTEFGILFPFQLGYSYQVVRDFMNGTFDFFLNTQDAALGFSVDEDRLVQAWSWFSLNVPEYDPVTKQGFNGNLFNPVTKEIMPLGQDFRSYVDTVRVSGIDLGVQSLQIEPSYQVITALTPVSVTVDLRNWAGEDAANIVLDAYLQPPDNSAPISLGSTTLAELAAGCQGRVQLQLDLQSHISNPGDYQIIIEVHAEHTPAETNLADNRLTQTLLILAEPFSNVVYLPVIER